jgi:hypothetical protein
VQGSIAFKQFAWCRYGEEVRHSHPRSKWHLWPPQHEGMRLHLSAMCESSLPAAERVRLGMAVSTGGTQAHASTAAPAGANAAPPGAAVPGNAAPEANSYRSFEERVLSLLTAASLADGAALRQFMRSHLPGTDAGSGVSPYVDPRLLLCYQNGRGVNVLGTRWCELGAQDGALQFRRTRTGTPAFELDCQAALTELAQAQGPTQAARCAVSHRFHPHLPLVVTVCNGVSCMIVHYRAERAQHESGAA